MAWYELSVSSHKSTVESVTAFLEEKGALAVSYYDAEDQPILEPNPDEVELWDKVITTGLFPLTSNPETLTQLLHQAFPDCLIARNTLPDQDWVNTWLSHFKAINFNDKLWVCPSRLDNESLVGEKLYLEPGLAFGTGQHQTTRLCLHYLSSQSLQDKSVLDFGCGTGILALAALKLGAKIGYGIDHDPQALYSARENAKKNHIDPVQLPVLSDQVDEVPPCDIVVANILLRPLISLADTLTTLCKSQGTIIFAGILKEQVPQLQAAYQAWFDFKPYCIEEEDWILLVGRKKT